MKIKWNYEALEPGTGHGTKRYQRVVASCYLVTQSCLTLCDPMDCSTPDFPVLHYLPEFAQTHVHWVSDTIQPSHPLPPPSLNLIFPRIRVFSKKSVFHISGQSIRVSASPPVLLMNIQGWFSLEYPGFFFFFLYLNFILFLNFT